jgi:AraC-like DNA-binding protein
MTSPVQRKPIPGLGPFVDSIWASQPTALLKHTERERMIPSGSMHLVFRFSSQPIRIFRSVEDLQGAAFHGGVVGGIRSAYYVKDVAPVACTVGASLRPGACEALFGVPASELSGRHVALEDLWGSDGRVIGERLQEAGDLEQRLQVLESLLVKRVPRVSGIHPAIAHALGRLSTNMKIGEIVEETGYSHRHFVQLFHRSVGLSPRAYARLLRFQKTLRQGIDETRGRWIDVALEAGYADQSHFNREFRERTGISPTEYLLHRRADSRHVSIPGQFRSRQPNTQKA